MVHISKHQLFCLMMLFEIGSTSLYILGSEANQDAWIAILLGTVGGVGLVWIYIQLQTIFPENNLVQIIIKLLGKIMGIPLVILYGLYFFYKSGVILREFSELILTTYLQRTPVIVISISLMSVIVFVCCLGLEVFGRTSEIFLPIFLIFIIMTYILVTFSGKINMKELMPILGRGIMPPINASYPRILNFPFGEAFVFFMYWRCVTPKNSVKKTALLAAVLSGLIITISAIIIISALSIEIASQVTVPFLQVVKLIDIGDILTNLDAIGVTIIFIGGFYKIAVFFYGTILVIQTLFNLNSIKILIIVTGFLVISFSYFFITSYQFAVWLAQKIHPLLMNTPLLIFNPILLLGIAKLKIRKGDKSK
ncbi:spore germination protein [Clostridium felsineum]|uniref:GerAB/ArcD/ProY family transporter n=1 Tax=Clostridium felsineum TaxID=36839 RepID=UPI00214D9F83|nr:spore germination protein [Clostridium felsineum]MCR3760575.1 spore germination protein [Clostridium felsineum]